MSLDVLARNNVQVYGHGSQTLMFAHGFGCDQSMWRAVAPAFENDYRIVLFDYVGCGKSNLGAYDASRYSDLHGYTQDILDICQALHLTDIIFAGHSVSGMTGLLASIAQPQLFERLIVVNPSPCYINDPPLYIGGFEREQVETIMDQMEQNYRGWAHFLAPTAILNPDKPQVIQEFENSLCATDPTLARGFARAIFFSDYRNALDQVTVPTLIVQSCEDLIAPPEVGIYIHQNLLRSELQVLEATGHCPHMSHPEELTRVIKKYLASPLHLN